MNEMFALSIIHVFRCVGVGISAGKKGGMRLAHNIYPGSWVLGRATSFTRMLKAPRASTLKSRMKLGAWYVTSDRRLSRLKRVSPK